METIVKLVTIAGPIVAGFGAWLVSFEARLKGKVSEKTFDVAIRSLQTQNERIESHVWDLMRSQGVEPSVDVPEKIRNNSMVKDNNKTGFF